jgi:hypothetical protein
VREKMETRRYVKVCGKKSKVCVQVGIVNDNQMETIKNHAKTIGGKKINVIEGVAVNPTSVADFYCMEAI